MEFRKGWLLCSSYMKAALFYCINTYSFHLRKKGFLMLDFETTYIKHVLHDLFENDLISYDEWQSALINLGVENNKKIDEL